MIVWYLKILENRADLDETARYKPAHPNLHCFQTLDSIATWRVERVNLNTHARVATATLYVLPRYVSCVFIWVWCSLCHCVVNFKIQNVPCSKPTLVMNTKSVNYITLILLNEFLKRRGSYHNAIVSPCYTFLIVCQARQWMTWLKMTLQCCVWHVTYSGQG